MSDRLVPSGVLADRSARGILLMVSRDPDAKLTFLRGAGGAGRDEQGLVCKVATTATAAAAVDREARTLVELRRMQLGRVRHTVPRYVSSAPPSPPGSPARSSSGPRPGPAMLLVSNRLPGRPMSFEYHRWRHTARPAAVARDIDLALHWLEALWAETAADPAPLTWPGDVTAALARRWDGTPGLTQALERLEGPTRTLGARVSPRAAVHGDFWFGNVLVDGDEVTGVVDWEAGEPCGWPLRDAARFLLSYSLYLDRHARRGHAVHGHRGLRRGANGDAVRYALLGQGWYPTLIRDRLVRSLRHLGLPGHLWYDTALVGIAEVAASANHEEFGLDHLRLLIDLPSRPPRPRRWTP